MSVLAKPAAAPGTLRVLAALLSYPDAAMRRDLVEMSEILHRERALPPERLGELDALLIGERIAAAERRCICSSTCTATRATVARR